MFCLLFSLGLFFQAEAQGLFDEFSGQEEIDQLPEAKATQEPDICIRGILYDEKNPLAIINGKYVGIGDSIQGVSITGISASSVSFEYQGLYLEKEIGQGCEDKSGLPRHRNDFESAIKKARKNFGLTERTYGHRDALAEEEIEQALGLLSFLFFLLGIPMYVYFAITLQIVAHKTNTSPAWLAWIPGANVFLMCAIAQRSIIWAVLILFLPITLIGAIPAFIMMFIVHMDIAVVCAKPKWLAILTIPIVPLGIFIYWGYLAFSKINFDEPIKVERIPDEPETNIPPAYDPGVEPSGDEGPEETRSDSAVKERPEANDDDPPIYNG
ncbi:MAG: hypothetical protein JW867_04085 [Candidatus Omnitrophica bacterium]|nr:hypothetical protein [Candidatus Omnitrophota bacterium]